MKLRNLAAILATSAMVGQVKAYTPWTKGAFETGKYRNVFV